MPKFAHGDRIAYADAMTRFLTLAGILACAILAALLAGVVARSGASARFAQQVAADAQLRQALLTSEIARFRLMPLALGEDRDVVALMAGDAGAAPRLNRKLEAMARDTGAAVIYVVRRDGMALAASNWRDPASFVNRNYGFRSYFRLALRDGAGEQFGLGTVSHKAGLYLARRGAGDSVVVVKLDFDRIEAQWRAAGGITFVTDPAGVVVVTSRPEWRFAATKVMTAPQIAAARAEAEAPAILPAPYAVLGDGRIRVPGMAGALMMAQTAPDGAGWRVHLAQPTARAVDATVRMAQGAAVAVVLGLAGLALWLAQRAQRRRRHTAALEGAVAERTADLRREIEERAAAEARAATLREGLRQANRLATLGQIAASVAHETAQPVAAIRNYAATSRQFLDRGEGEEVRANLQAIDRLATRIGTVTAELRGFARKGGMAPGPVPLVDVLDGARLLLKERLSRVDLKLPALRPGLAVLGDHVRLEQVLVNILQNALEAVENETNPKLVVAVQADAEEVHVIVSDNGPGIAPDVADRLFTPFATSRPAGLGLGLVIAQDIASDFGGSLRLLPSDRGAVFAITLRRAA